MDGDIMNKELWINPPKLNKKYNMTPSEKAQELYLKYYGIPLYVKTVKECCYIAVDEIIEFMRMDDEYTETTSNANSKWVNYWLEVKQEINKL